MQCFFAGTRFRWKSVSSGVYIYGVVYVVWCGQVPRPHALRELRYNPTRPPMSYVTLPTCVCKYFRDVSACTQIQTLTHEHKCFSQRVRDALVTEARDQACDYVFFTDCCWCLTLFCCTSVNAEVVSVGTDIMLEASQVNLSING